MLSATSEYSIRALIELSRLEEGESLLCRDIAQMTGISYGYLAKTMLTLKRGEIVIGKRGKNGGYQLAKPAGAIYLREVVHLIDGDSVLPECLLRNREHCSDDNPCTAHKAWGKVRASFFEFLDKNTIADLASRDSGSLAG